MEAILIMVLSLIFGFFVGAVVMIIIVQNEIKDTGRLKIGERSWLCVAEPEEEQ